MADPRLDEIRKRLEAGKKQPWHLTAIENADRRYVEFGGPADEVDAFSMFIREAPEDIAYLLARLEKATKLVQAGLGTHGEPCAHPEDCQFVSLEEKP